MRNKKSAAKLLHQTAKTCQYLKKNAKKIFFCVRCKGRGDYYFPWEIDFPTDFTDYHGYKESVSIRVIRGRILFPTDLKD